MILPCRVLYGPRQRKMREGDGAWEQQDESLGRGMHAIEKG